MKKIFLSIDEKKALLSIQQGKITAPAGMNMAEFFLAVSELKRKGLIDAEINYDEIIDVKPSYIGSGYVAQNPTLVNPVGWFKILTVAGLIITAIATIITMIVALIKL